MPTYEYECTHCHLVFEEERPITAPARKRCPQCRHKVKRLISGGAGILFKGSGFYVNDSRGSQDTGTPDPAPVKAKTAPATATTKTTESSSAD